MILKAFLCYSNQLDLTLKCLVFSELIMHETHSIVTTEYNNFKKYYMQFIFSSQKI